MLKIPNCDTTPYPVESVPSETSLQFYQHAMHHAHIMLTVFVDHSTRLHSNLVLYFTRPPMAEIPASAW